MLQFLSAKDPHVFGSPTTFLARMEQHIVADCDFAPKPSTQDTPVGVNIKSASPIHVPASNHDVAVPFLNWVSYWNGEE